jgi:hypothetical protein
MPQKSGIALLKTDRGAIRELFAKEENLGKQDGEKRASLCNLIKAAVVEAQATIERKQLEYIFVEPVEGNQSTVYVVE